MAATNTSSAPTVTTPIPIFQVAHRYMLYDVNVVTYLRREHNICGVLSGTLPQASQQNVFLGLPLELMPEEARLLVEKQVGYIVDDTADHKSKFLAGNLNPDERRAFQSALRKQGQAAANDASKRSDDRKKAALSKLGSENWNDIPDDMFASRAGGARGPKKKRGAVTPTVSTPTTERSESLFDNTPPRTSASTPAPSVAAFLPEPYAVTPTTSGPPHLPSPAPPVPPPPPSSSGVSPATTSLPDVSASAYPLYKHLHEKGYFLSPGLRFGCQYTAYPGDPLRYHSHFLADGKGWDEEFDLMELVAGGRLGTGVKKGFLVGGKEERTRVNGVEGEKGEGKVRAFCIEWGGM